MLQNYRFTPFIQMPFFKNCYFVELQRIDLLIHTYKNTGYTQTYRHTALLLIENRDVEKTRIERSSKILG